MAKKKIFIIEDDRDISEMIRYNLEKEGFQTASVFDGEEAFATVKTGKPDLVILDIMLPNVDGLEICKDIRKNQSTEDIPVIMLTAKSQETDKIVGLELGADDYIAKPFSPRELIARIKAVLRRKSPQDKSKKIGIGNIIIDTLKYRVFISGNEIKLTSTEFKLLLLLAEKKGIVIPRNEILDNVFGYNSDIYDRTVDTHIKSIRKKLGKAKDFIETVRGVGYRFQDID